VKNLPALVACLGCSLFKNCLLLDSYLNSAVY
jgi:hypothetical protein